MALLKRPSLGVNVIVSPATSPEYSALVALSVAARVPSYTLSLAVTPDTVTATGLIMALMLLGWVKE